jgi:hypothetical protein
MIEVKLKPQLACERDTFRARFMSDIKDRKIDVCKLYPESNCMGKKC